MKPRRLPLFPLRSVLFPHGVLPLQVFEPRYLKMMNELVDGDGRFGAVLIERGDEVGGGDHRFDVGTVAKVVRVGTLEDGRLAVVAVGIRRFRVTAWLPDDPYPQAMVAGLSEPEASYDLPDRVQQARRIHRRTLALATELGSRVGDIDPELPDSPVAAAWQLCDAAPLEQLDRQQLLEIDDAGSRLERLSAFLQDRADLLEARLSAG
jgi:Lon protease-like protein